MTAHRRPHTRGILNHCQQPGAFLLLELRGQGAAYFLEPGSIRVGSEHAKEAIATGWLAVRDVDLLGQPMTWIYAPKTSRVKGALR
jgi:hypothetical protein